MTTFDDRPRYQFPSIPHLATSTTVDDDEKMTPQEAKVFLASGPFTVLEKIDGSNVGLWFEPYGNELMPFIQTRWRVLTQVDEEQGRVLTDLKAPQHRRFHDWVQNNSMMLRQLLQDRYCLFCEILFLPHGIFYDRPPLAQFCCIDIYDRRAQAFPSFKRIEALLEGSGIVPAPVLGYDVEISTEDRLIDTYHGRSQFGNVVSEGLVLRRDQGPWLSDQTTIPRAKWRRPGFRAGEHFRKG